MEYDFYEELRRFLLAGVGATALTVEKAKEHIEEFVEKGKLTVEQGKVLNEQLKHDIKEKVKETVTVNVTKEKSAQEFIDSLGDLSSDELAALKAKLSELEKTEKQDEDGAGK